MARTRVNDKALKRSKAQKRKGGNSYTRILLLLMLIAFIAGGLYAVGFGKKALQGVNPVPQGVKLPKLPPPPTLQPTPSTKKKPDSTSFLNEPKTIKMAQQKMATDWLATSTNSTQLVDAKDRYSSKSDETLKPYPTEQINNWIAGNHPSNQATKADPLAPLVSTNDRGIVMEVLSTRELGNEVILQVGMQNFSTRSVNFLYSFLNVTDQSGRSINAIAEGLPQELPPTGAMFRGTVSIPRANLDNSNTVSIGLTDYPNQELKLRIEGVPVN